MKKLLLLVLIGLLIALSVFIGINGFEIGQLQILGFTGIQDKNAELDAKIQEASKLAEKDYKKAISTVEENAKELEQKKKEYEEMIDITVEDGEQVVNQIERYEVETLWVKLGNYATSEGAIMKMDIVKGVNSAQDTYDLNFTVNGSYISITDFISDIENDSTLGFKIEDFKMLPGNSKTGNELLATFTCKDIAIKDVTQTSNTDTEEVTTENDTDENTTSKDKTNTNTNSTSKDNANTNTTSKDNTNNTTTTNTNSSGNTAE